MDVKNAFSNGNLSEEFYMQPPPSLFIEPNKVCHFWRAFYNLKQPSQAWFAKFNSTISRLGYIALATLHKPHTYCEASTDPLWKIAVKEELDALSKNHIWDLMTLPPRKFVVGCKWIYKI